MVNPNTVPSKREGGKEREIEREEKELFVLLLSRFLTVIHTTTKGSYSTLTSTKKREPHMCTHVCNSPTKFPFFVGRTVKHGCPILFWIKQPPTV